MSTKILIVLLLFGVQLLRGQTVSKLEFENGTEVYQIIELQNNTVKFVNPWKKQPILREIIFYKVVEKPYIEKNDELEAVTKEKEKPKKPDFDESIRPFTNGQGFQFVNRGSQSQDENTEHTNAPKKENNVNENSNSTNSDNNENHENDDKISENNDNNKNDNDKNNYKKEEDDDDDDYDDNDYDDKSNVKKPNVDKYDDEDDGAYDDEDDKNANKKHSNDDSKIEDDDSGRDNDDSRGAGKAVDSMKGDDKKITEEKEEDEKTREDKVYEEEINLAKKLRSVLFNSTKEKYRTIVRNNENATHERKRREVSQNVPEAPKLPALDVKAFPSYIQRMLANRPTFTNTQDSVNVRTNYNADLFHKMDGIFSNNKPKTYGFKINKDRSEAWNDIHKTQHNQENVIAPIFKDLSGSQTNNPYEIISEPDIEPKNDFISDEEQTTNKKETFSKNKDEIDGSPKNIYSNTRVLNNNVHKNQESVKINNEKLNTDHRDKFSGTDIKDKLITMLQNIDNKFTNGKPPKTYGMSIKGAKVQTWNDISVTPTVTKYENANKENIVENKPNKEENLNHEKNRLNLDFREDPDNYDNAHKQNIVITKQHGSDKNILENNSNKVNKQHIDTSQHYINPLNYNEDNYEHEPNKPEGNVGDDSVSPDEAVDNYDEEFDQMSESTNKIVNDMSETSTEEPFDAENYDEINEPKDNYNEFKNSQYVLSTTERLTEEPEVTKENLLIDNEDLKLKMEESFDNIIKQFPKLKEINLTGTKAVVKNNNNDDGNNKKPVKPNTYGMHLEGDHGYIWNLLQELTNPGKVTYVGNLNKINETKPHIDHEATTMRIVENKVKNHTEPPTNEKIEITTKQPIITTTEKQNTVEEENKEVTRKPIENEPNHKNNCSCKTDNVNEDEFWKWLSNWTSTYMEVLNERVETLVQNEVANQLKQINDDKNNTKVNDGNKVDEGNKTNNTTNDNKVEEKSNTTALKPELNNNLTDTTTERNNSGTISKENELNEVYNKTDQDTNKGKNNSLPVNIKSETIYGNAIGNDHVTNIFIFYPNVDSNKTIDKVEEKPANITINERFGGAEEDKGNNLDDTVSKSKDLINSQNNTNSTVSSQQKNKTDATDKSKKSSTNTTTEDSTTRSETEEELKIKTNGTDTESINNQNSNNTTTKLSDTIDATDSNTEQIDKTETTTEQSIKNDETTPISPDRTTISETEKSDSTTEKSDSASNKSDSTTEKKEKSDSTSEQSDTATEKSDSTTDTSDVTSTEKSAGS